MLGKKINEHRVAAGVSVPQLAEALGKGRGTIYAWESGDRRPSAQALGRLATYLNVSHDDRIQLLVMLSELPG